MRSAFPFRLALTVALTAAPATAEAATCAIPSVCFQESNTAAGNGIEGDSASAYGVVGVTTFEATTSGLRRAGVAGLDRSTNGKPYDIGVLGTSSFGTGVSGRSSASYGVTGFSNNFVGTYGASGANAGVFGVTTAGPQTTLGVAAGVVGVNQSSSGSQNIAGVIGKTGAAGYGVAGLSSDGASAGVFGSGTTGPGVSGSSTGGVGVLGTTTLGNGVSGTSTTGYGLYGSGEFGLVATGSLGGVFASSTSGASPAVEAAGTGAGTGIYAHTSTGIGGDFATASSNSNPAALMNNTAGNGTDSSGTYIGVVARASSSGFPFLATDLSGAHDLFWVDGSGNIKYHGTVSGFVKTVHGREGTAFASKTTSPTLEDVGEGRIAAGQGAVTFDAAFAAELDPRTPYHVFLTPEGDTRGLYVATKTARGFVVREAQGGRSSVAFDYRVVGTEFGTAGLRTAFVDRDHVPGEPNAPIVHPALTRPPARSAKVPVPAVDRSLRP